MTSPSRPRKPGPQVFVRRIAGLQEAMARTRIRAAVLTPSPNLAYFTGYAGVQSDRLLALLVPAEGPCGLVVPAFEAPRFSSLPGVSELITWKEHEDPHEKALAFLEGRSEGRQRLVLEPTMAFASAWSFLKGAKERFTVEDGSPLFETMRRRKDNLELSIMAEAVRITHHSLEETFARVQAGMTEAEIARLLKERFEAVNPGAASGGLVQVGEASALPHGTPGARRLGPGAVLLVDCGTCVHGYHSDITRTVVLGRAPDRFRRLYGIVLKAQEAGIRALLPGSSCEDADRAARQVIEAAGYGPRFIHRLGHGIGLEGHESPYLAAGNVAPLMERDTVTVEPGIYLPREFGIRIEDVFTVTPEGGVPVGNRPEGPLEIGEAPPGPIFRVDLGSGSDL